MSSQFPVVGLVLCFLPCGLHPVSLSLACWLFPSFFCHSSWLCAFLVSGFLYSLAVSLSWAPLSRFSYSTASSSVVLRWHLDPAFCSSGVLHPTLTSGLLFLFLATAFPTVQLVPRFSLFLSDLVFCSSRSCLGLQWLWSSCPFRCWGSRLPLPIAVFRISSRGLGSFLFPDFVPGWLVLRLLRWCSAVSSCFPAFSRLADPCSFYSPALSLCSILGGSALHVFLLLAFGPLGWLLILSPSPWSTRCSCWSVPTLPSCSVGPPGSPRLALPLRSGVHLPGCTRSVSSVCIDLASFLSCSSGVLRPGGCFP